MDGDPLTRPVAELVPVISEDRPSRRSRNRLIAMPLAAVALIFMHGDSYKPKLHPELAVKNTGAAANYVVPLKDGYDLLPAKPARTTEGDTTKLRRNGFSFSGFNIAFNREAIESSLKSNEVAVISLRDPAAPKKKSLLFQQVVRNENVMIEPLDLEDRMANDFGPAYFGPSYSAKGTGYKQNDSQALGDPDYSGRLNTKRVLVDGGLRLLPVQTLEFAKYKYEIGYLAGIQVTKKSERPQLEEEISVPLRLHGNVNCPGGTERVISNVVLTGAYKSRACRYLGEVEQIMPKGYTIILDDIKQAIDISDNADAPDKMVLLNLPFAKTIGSHDVEQGIALHEAAHTTYLNLPKNNPVRQSVDKAWAGIKRVLNKPMPTSEKKLENYDGSVVDPAWAILTESTYEERILGYKNSFAGHPWDLSTEMSSSTLDILAVYPHEFVKYYSQLSNAQKPAIQAAVVASLSLIKSRAGTKTLQELVPDYASVLKSLDLKPDQIPGRP